MPRGFPLGEVVDLLPEKVFKVSTTGNGLSIREENRRTLVDVVAPVSKEGSLATITSVVIVKTKFGGDFTSIPNLRRIVCLYNRMATLGSLIEHKGEVYVGSRLTVYENEEPWPIHIPFVCAGIVTAPSALHRVITEDLTNYGVPSGESDWTEADLLQAQKHLSQFCVCTVGGKSLTAEFPLGESSISAISGRGMTALWQITGERPHPVIGGGLFCQLQLPYTFGAQAKLDEVIAQLNRMEMAPHDLPPHFGAWCEGELGGNPAYVCFLPNELHCAEGIAVNVSVWAIHRAEWASAMLAALGLL